MSETAKSENKKLYKDWFDSKAAQALSEQITRVHPQFSDETFQNIATHGLETLEFKARVQQFAHALRECLPKHTKEALDILRESLPPILPDCESPTDGWLQWPVGEFVALYGLEETQASFDLMLELTQRFTSEFAVRPFVEEDPAGVIARFLPLTQHPSPHVRRWCSEGLRPKLPWGKVLGEFVEEPRPLLPVLELLRDDPELYVRRSVANTLNDIAKNHPELVVGLCERWSIQSNSLRNWLTKHALRSLVKKAHPGALKLQGYSPPKKIVSQLEASPQELRIGEGLNLKLELENTSRKTQKLQVDYAVFFIKKNKKAMDKVFKWKSLKLAPGEKVQLQKKQVFKQTSVRALYPGFHRLEVQINGKRLAKSGFLLLA